MYIKFALPSFWFDATSIHKQMSGRSGRSSGKWLLLQPAAAFISILRWEERRANIYSKQALTTGQFLEKVKR